MTTTPMQTTQDRDRELTDYLYRALRTIPQEIGGTEAMIASLTRDKKAAEQRLEDAELNAQMRTEIKGSNAEARKIEMKVAISKDPDYRAAQKEIAEYEGEIEIQQAEMNSKRREFQAAIALAELHAARINLMAKLQRAADTK